MRTSCYRLKASQARPHSSRIATLSALACLCLCLGPALRSPFSSPPCPPKIPSCRTRARLRCAHQLPVLVVFLNPSIPLPATRYPPQLRHDHILAHHLATSLTQHHLPRPCPPPLPACLATHLHLLDHALPPLRRDQSTTTAVRRAANAKVNRLPALARTSLCALAPDPQAKLRRPRHPVHPARISPHLPPSAHH